MELGSSLTFTFLWASYFTQHMLSSDSIFLKAHDSLIMLITSQKHQACKIPVLIKQQTFAFLGILQIYLQN